MFSGSVTSSGMTAIDERGIDTGDQLSLEDRMERVSTLVNSLPTGNRSEILKMILDLILCFKADSLNRVTMNVELRHLFDCLNTSDEVELKLSCRILKIMLESIDPLALFELCGDSIRHAIRHPNAEVVTIVLKEVLRAADVPNLRPIMCSDDFLQQAIAHLFNEDLKVSRLASDLMTSLVVYPPATEIIFSPTTMSHCKSSMAVNDNFTIRAYEVVVGMAKKSPNILNECVKCGLLPELIKQIQKDDPLMQLNVIELFCLLCEVRHGFEYLNKQGVFKSIISLLKSPPDNSTFSLVLPGYLKLLAIAMKLNPDIKFPEVIIWMTDTLEHETDEVLIVTIYESIATIATSVQGKLVLKELGGNMEALLGSFPRRLKNSSEVTKVRLMAAVTDIITLEEKFQTPENLEITYQWFKTIHNSPLDIIMPYYYQPFDDFQLAALNFLQSVVEQPWGVQQISRCVGLVEYLMDRNRVCSALCKELKYDIVKILLNSPNATIVFSESLLQQMRFFVEAGPYVNIAQNEVALEEQGV